MAYFADKVAIVTGGASGIGRMLCEELGKQRAIVIVADINLEGARYVASAINESGGRASAERLEVSRADDVQSLVDKTSAEYGRLDLMFNNAGVAIGGEVRDLNLEHWRRIIDINLLGVIYGTDAAYRVMLKQGSGHIVNTASVAGLAGFPTMVPYATTKFAVVGLSTSLRAEAKDLGVKVSAVCPGFVQTNIFNASTVENADKEKALAQLPFKPMDARAAAKRILRGVERNRAIIIFPLHARVMWWLNRISFILLFPLSLKTVRDFRKARFDDEAKPAGHSRSAGNQ